MISLTFESKHAYEAMMKSFLGGSITAEEMAQAFFKLRHADIDREHALKAKGFHPDQYAWEDLFAELFNACYDLDMFPESNEKASPHWIDEKTFRQRIEDLLPRFEAFKLSSLQ